MSKTKDDQAGGAPDPFAELTRLFGQFKVPGFDVSAVAEGWRKDVEALVTANRTLYDSMQAVARRQTEMLTQAMARLQDAAKGAAGGVGLGDPAKQAELARTALQQAIADMQELSEMVRKSQANAIASITQRATQHMQEVRQMLQPK
jgi:phasin family protein